MFKMSDILIKTHLDLLNLYMSCSICGEVFVKPVKLPCMHTFCKTCILQWERNQKDCPYCRAKYEKVPCDDTHLASYIEKLIGSTYTDDENKQRDELVKSHTDLEKQLQPPAFEIAQINRLSGINPGSQDRERRNIDLEADRAILNLQSAGEIQSRRNSSWEEFPRRHSAIAQSFGVNKFCCIKHAKPTP